jgi:hypothetical protein
MWTNVVSSKVKRTHWKFTSRVTHLTMKVTIKADNKKNVMKGARFFNKEMIRPAKANVNKANWKEKGSLVVKVGTEAMADVHKNELMVDKRNVVGEEMPSTNSSICARSEKNFKRRSANWTDIEQN